MILFINKWKRLLTRTVPVNNFLLTGTVFRSIITYCSGQKEIIDRNCSGQKEIIDRNTVPVNKKLLTGTVPVNNLFLKGSKDKCCFLHYKSNKPKYDFGV